MRKWLLVALLAMPVAAGAQMMPERLRLLLNSRYSELEKLAEKEVAEKPDSARLMPLCVAYAKLKRYNKIFPCLERLEANIKAGDTAMQDLEEMGRNSPLMMGLARFGSAFMGGEQALKGNVEPFVRLTRAEVYMELREYDKAIAAADDLRANVPKTFQEERMFTIFALGVQGLSRALAGRREEALKFAAELSEISTSYPYGLHTGTKWLGVIRTYAALGEFKKAHEVFESEDPLTKDFMSALATGVGGAVAGLEPGQSFTAWTDLPLEFLQYKTRLEVGKVAEAKEGFDKLLAQPETKDNGEIYWLLLYDRGRIAEKEGDLPGALDFWRRAIEVIEQQRSTINTEANKIGFVGDKQDVYRAMVSGLFTATRYADAFDYVERSKARALVDLLADKKDFAVAAPNAEEIRKLLATAQQQELEARAQAGAPSTRSAPAVVATIREQAPELASLVTVTSTPLAEIQSRLPEDEAIVEYYYDEGVFVAFVVTRTGLQGRRLDANGLEADIRALRAAIEKPFSREHEAPAQALHTRLISPIQDLIANRKLLIVSHGALHYLPFAALHDGKEYLLDKHSLRFLPSASVIRYLRTTQPGTRAGVLAFGNPDLGDPRFDLKFAQEEALAIAQKVPQSRALLRKEASEAAFRQYAAGFSTLHFATHGEFHGDAPLRSALLLAKDGDSDGLLTVGKLYSTRIAADLVTLSACETGLGKVASGDDVVGLTRGFLYAGASTVVASLWKVDDRATAALMTRFYDELRTSDRREALRSAQRAAREQFAHPFFWAAFQLTGQAN
jgi:CHAT domain-containing protein